MSADNGIYILCLKDEWRVKHISAVDNLNWHFSKGGIDSQLNLATTYLEFSNCKIFNNKQEALIFAFELADVQSILEYGVSSLKLFPLSWSELETKAKQYAMLELEALNNSKWDERWNYEREKLKAI